MFHQRFPNLSGIRVKREKATPRDLRGLSGSIIINAIAFNSYIYIGSRKYKIDYNKGDLDRFAWRKIVNLNDIISLSSRINVDYLENITYGDLPVIPGSSFKGCVRSRLELLFHSVDNIVPSCFIRSGHIPKVPIPQKAHGWRHYKIWNDVITENRGNACDATKAEYFKDIELCIICDIFGTSGIASRVCFSNLIPRNKDCLVRLHLDFGEKIFAFKKDTVFDGEITFLGLNLVELGLIFIGLNVHNNKPILIGKSKYRKRMVNNRSKEYFGRLKINIDRIEFARYSDTALIKNVLGNLFDEKRHLIEGEGVTKFVSYTVDKAFQMYGKWLRNINEVDKLG